MTDTEVLLSIMANFPESITVDGSFVYERAVFMRDDRAATMGRYFCCVLNNVRNAGFGFNAITARLRTSPAPSAPQQSRSDEELAREALAQFSLSGRDWYYERDIIAAACATARAQGRADALAARGEASPGTPPETPANAAAPATGARERVAEAIWRAWWRAHGESETEIQFPQLYENARARWLEIADAGLRAYAREE